MESDSGISRARVGAPHARPIARLRRLGMGRHQPIAELEVMDHRLP